MIITICRLNKKYDQEKMLYENFSVYLKVTGDGGRGNKNGHSSINFYLRRLFKASNHSLITTLNNDYHNL